MQRVYGADSVPILSALHNNEYSSFFDMCVIRRRLMTARTTIMFDTGGDLCPLVGACIGITNMAH